MPYIDRDNLIKELSTMYKSPTSADDFMTVGYDHAIADMVVTVHEHPAAEVVELVRCKECKYMTEHYDTDGNVPYWTCSEWDSGTDYDGFCSYAERMEE